MFFTYCVLLVQRKIKVAHIMFVLYLGMFAIIFIFAANIECAVLTYFCTANRKQTLKLIYYGKEECYYAI